MALALLWILTASGIISTGIAILIGALAMAYFAFVAYETYRLQSMKPKVGAETMIGKRGKAVCDLAPEGAIEVEGEYWKAVSDRPVKKGAFVEVVKVEGSKVTVIPDEPRQLDG